MTEPHCVPVPQQWTLATGLARVEVVSQMRPFGGPV